MGRKAKVQRVGKRQAKLEREWAELPKEHRTEKVLLFGAKCAGLPEETSKERFRVALALIHAHQAVT